MARNAAQGVSECPGLLSSDVRFRQACADDDAEIRAMLRAGIMDGPIRLTMEREPDYFAMATVRGTQQQTLICRDGQEKLLGIGARTRRLMWCDGQVRPVSYLSQLRLADGVGARRGIITGGYAHMQRLDETDLTITTIMEGNERARRLLEAGLAGMPTYTLLGEFDSFLYGRVRPPRRARGIDVQRLAIEDVDEVTTFINQQRAGEVLAPFVQAPVVRAAMEQRRLVMYRAVVAGRTVATLGRQDVSDHAQIRVHGYAKGLRAFRLAANLLGRVAGWPRLPAPGELCECHYAVHASATKHGEQAMQSLLAVAAADARRAGGCLVAGAAVMHPMHLHMARSSCLAVASRIYAVEWPGSRAPIPHPLRGQPIHLEVCDL